MGSLTLVGRRIWHRRKKAGLTLDALTQLTGIAPTQLPTFENGRREPRLSQLEAIGAASGIGLTDLLSDEPPDVRTALEVELAPALVNRLMAGLPATRS